MAAQNIQIEIVPFPDPTDLEAAAPVAPVAPERPDGPSDKEPTDPATTSPVTDGAETADPVSPGASPPARSGLVPVDPPTQESGLGPADAAEPEPEPTPGDAKHEEPATAPGEAPEEAPRKAAGEAAEAHPMADGNTEPDVDTEPDVGTELVPMSVGRDSRHRVPQSAPTELSGADDIVPIERDASALRGTSISGRLLFLTLGSVALVAIVVLASIGGVARVSDSSREISRIADAKASNAAVLTELRVAHSANSDAVDASRLEALAADATESARPWVDAGVADAADKAVAAYAAARVGGADDEAAAYARAVSATSRLSDRLRDRQLDAVDRAQAQRTTATAVILALFLVGSVLLVVLGRVIGRSVVGPLRSLGRSLRRFGDGDLKSRSQIASDEVGTLARSFNVMAESVGDRVHHLNAVAERDAQLRMVADALDLAERETDVYRIVEQALAILTPDNPGELLVNEPTSTRLWQVSTNPSAGPGGCPVEIAEDCPAMRRAQAFIWDGPGAINACPKLREHQLPCSAACVPVGVNGHLLGVLHVTAPEHHPPDAEIVEQLVTLAGQVGVRVGTQRTLETTRLQASTDGLTGLANRRMLKARLGDLLRGQVSFALAVADVDHFKHLNDKFGHETGDRALQLFAKVLEDNVRGHDLVARYGGEEFVLVYPELTVKKAMEVIERIRVALEKAIEAAGLPPFTCSFGVTHSSSADSVDGIIRIADAGLLQAKELGRNRVVFADLDLAAEVFGSAGAPTVVDLTESAAAADGAEAPDQVAMATSDES